MKRITGSGLLGVTPAIIMRESRPCLIAKAITVGLK
jgi:hypothetical protein